MQPDNFIYDNIETFDTPQCTPSPINEDKINKQLRVMAEIMAAAGKRVGGGATNAAEAKKWRDVAEEVKTVARENLGIQDRNVMKTRKDQGAMSRRFSTDLTSGTDPGGVVLLLVLIVVGILVIYHFMWIGLVAGHAIMDKAGAFRSVKEHLDDVREEYSSYALGICTWFIPLYILIETISISRAGGTRMKQSLILMGSFVALGYVNNRMPWNSIIRKFVSNHTKVATLELSLRPGIMWFLLVIGFIGILSIKYSTTNMNGEIGIGCIAGYSPKENDSYEGEVGSCHKCSAPDTAINPCMSAPKSGDNGVVEPGCFIAKCKYKEKCTVNGAKMSKGAEVHETHLGTCKQELENDKNLETPKATLKGEGDARVLELEISCPI